MLPGGFPIYYALYNLTLLALSPLVALYLMQRYFSGKSRPGWTERWGHLPDALRARPTPRPRVWMHAVSAGEVVAAVPILRALRSRLPEHEIFLSVLTPAGHEMATQQAARYTDAIFYAPFDFPWVVRRVINEIDPQVYVSLESELWPNLLHHLKRYGTATVMVNGRLSDKNYQRASRFGGGLFRWMLGNVDCLRMQSQADAERVRTLLGEPVAPERIAVVGNSKFDQEIARLAPEQVAALRLELKLPPDAPVFVAGSTRSPEEEAVILAAYKAMQAQHPDLCLLVAPRQIDRAEELAQAMRTAGLSPVRRTQLEAASAPVHHLILDTIGELANVYAVATFAFVGNSFLPVVKGGGQNLLQPLAHGKPVLFGPLTATIRSEVALATEAGVGFRCNDQAELVSHGLRFLSDEDLLCDIEKRALSLIAANRGASARYAEAIAALAGVSGFSHLEDKTQ